MDILDYILLPCIYVLRTAFTFIPLVIPMIFYLFFSSMFTFIAFEDYVIRRILLTVIKLLYYSSTYTFRFAQTTWLAFSFWPRFYWHLFGPSSKGRSVSDILFHTYTPPVSRQNENLWKIHTDKQLTCHRYDLLLSTGIQVRGTNQHHAQPLNQQFVSAYNAATSYTPIHDPFRLVKLHDHIRSGLTSPPDCIVTRLLVITSITITFLSLITIRGFRYYLNKYITHSKADESMLPKSEHKFRSSKLHLHPRPRYQFRKKRHRQFKRRRVVKSNRRTLPTLTISMLATDSSQYTADVHPFSLDTDGISFIIDNSATGAICNTKSMFVGPLVNHTINLVTAEGQSTTTKKVGTIRLVLKDDGGNDWSYDIPNVIFDSDSPYSLLGIPFLGQYFGSNTDDTYDEGTWIRSASTSSHFVWDHGKHERHFVHGPSNLPELLTNEGNTYFSAFCTRFSTFLNDRVHYAFSSAFTISPDGVHQPPAIISQEVEEDEFPEVQWYNPPNTLKPDIPPAKRVRFHESITSSASSHQDDNNQDFQIGSEVIYTRDGTAQNVVYEGVDRNGVNHYI